VKREAAREAELPTKLVPTYVLPNLLKRTGTPLLEGVSTNKRTRLAQQDDDPMLEKTTMLPILKILNEVYPKRTLENPKGRINAPNRTVQRKAEELAYLLNAGASGDAVQATVILVRMLNQADMNHIRQNIHYILGTENHEVNVDRIMTHGLVKFIQYHHTKGQQSKDVQNAIDVTLTATSFALPGEEEASLHNIASQILGIDEASGKHKNKALEMIASLSLFYPKERKTRANAYQEEEACCVSDFCHSDTSSRLDTKSYRCIKVKNPMTTLSKPHPLQVWTEVTLDARYASFAHWDIYKQWQLNNGDKTIGLTSFRAHVCPYVQDPTSRSCVDLIYLQCQEYMASLRNALKCRPSIKHRIEFCQSTLAHTPQESN
jgi:hypothetical protein